MATLVRLRSTPMPPPTNLFDDGGDARHDDEFDGSGSDGSTRPNYWIRRGIVIGVVGAALAVGAIVIAGTIGSNGTDTPTGTVSADWNRIVLVDERTGRVIVDDESGDEVARIDTRNRSVVDAAVVDSTAVVVSATATNVVDLDAETSTEFTLDADAITWPSGSGLTMIVASTGDERGTRGQRLERRRDRHRRVRADRRRSIPVGRRPQRPERTQHPRHRLGQLSERVVLLRA